MVKLRIRKRMQNIRLAGLYIVMACIALWCLFPLYFIIINSFKTRLQVYNPGQLFVLPQFSNYRKVLFDQGVGEFLLNSVIIAVSTTLLALIISSFIAYGLSRLKIRHEGAIMKSVLLVRQLPAIALVLPFFIIGFMLRLLDKHIYLIIIYLSFNIPLAVWMLKGFFDKVPIEIEEAALLDGCSKNQVVRHILMPVVAPGVGATGVLCFSYAWNEFLYPLMLTSIRAKTIPTVISEYVTKSGVQWGEMSAVAVMNVVPILVLAIIFRKNFINGLSFGATK